MRNRIKAERVFEDREVEFVDPRHGFVRRGFCYAEEGKFCRIRDCLGHRYKVVKTDVSITDETT